MNKFKLNDQVFIIRSGKIAQMQVNSIRVFAYCNDKGKPQPAKTEYQLCNRRPNGAPFDCTDRDEDQLFATRDELIQSL